MGGDFKETVDLIKEAAEAVDGLPLDMYVNKPEEKGAPNNVK